MPITLKKYFDDYFGIKKQELREKRMLHVSNGTYRQSDYENSILKPIPNGKGQTKDYAMDVHNKFPRYITGYTGKNKTTNKTNKTVYYDFSKKGFVPTLNFRYGKSYSRAADDSISEFSAKQRKLEEREREMWGAARTKSAPKLTPIRGKDEVARALREYTERTKFKGLTTFLTLTFYFGFRVLSMSTTLKN